VLGSGQAKHSSGSCQAVQVGLRDAGSGDVFSRDGFLYISCSGSSATGRGFLCPQFPLQSVLGVARTKLVVLNPSRTTVCVCTFTSQQHVGDARDDAPLRAETTAEPTSMGPIELQCICLLIIAGCPGESGAPGLSWRVSEGRWCRFRRTGESAACY